MRPEGAREIWFVGGGGIRRFRCPFRARMRGVRSPRASVAKLPQPWAGFPVPVGDAVNPDRGGDSCSRWGRIGLASIKRTVKSGIPLVVNTFEIGG